jgi:hypothetical protein
VFRFRRAVVGLAVLFLGACSSAKPGPVEADAGGAGGSPSTDLGGAAGVDSGSTAGGTAEAGASGAAEGGAAGAPDGVAGAPGDSEGGATMDACVSHFATSVESFTAGPGPTTGQSDLPQIVLGPPRGGGTTHGSLDVATLGNGGSITLGFAPSVIVDRPGPDFIVFENAFYVNGDASKPFAELATVEVSEDGQTFHAFPCTATAYPYDSCAGWHAVLANADENSIDPTDPAVAGGDAFDLADLGLARARFVRITDRVDQTGTAGSFDLDAVSIVHASCP